MIREAKQLDRKLREHGLAGTDEPRALFRQLATLIPDHSSFQKVLTAVEPEQRRNCYESLRALLRFEAKPMDVYLAEAGQQAEREQLPLVDDTQPTGLRPFMPTRNANPTTGDDHVIENPAVIGNIFGGNIELTLTCGKCTRQATFYGTTIVDATMKARKADWLWDLERKYDICPKCPAVRPN